MKKISLELPKYRLQLHLKLVKRRKPLLDEPILPTRADVNKRYRTGTFTGRLIRYFADHKSIRKIFASGFAALAIGISFVPQTTNVQAQGDETIIQAQTNLVTENGMTYPVEPVIINQNYNFFHPAIDFGGEIGQPVKPVMAGVAAYAGWDYSGYGNLVVIDSKTGNNSYEIYYAHLSKIEVKTGQTVNANTEIGKMGETGHATGPHLHLEIYQNGVHLNPLTVLSQ
jgi:murein DD-endopeptidase MepM/ murein hydrolase activator NlpD